MEVGFPLPATRDYYLQMTDIVSSEILHPHTFGSACPRGSLAACGAAEPRVTAPAENLPLQTMQQRRRGGRRGTRMTVGGRRSRSTPSAKRSSSMALKMFSSSSSGTLEVSQISRKNGVNFAANHTAPQVEATATR
jgi:hypothetical protein